MNVCVLLIELCMQGKNSKIHKILNVLYGNFAIYSLNGNDKDYSHYPTYTYIWEPQSLGTREYLISTSIIGSWIYDQRDETFVRLADTNCVHDNGGCTQFYSPKHLNGATVFVGGSRGSSGEKCAETLTYPWESSVWEKGKSQLGRIESKYFSCIYPKYQGHFFFGLSYFEL